MSNKVGKPEIRIFLDGREQTQSYFGFVAAFCALYEGMRELVERVGLDSVQARKKSWLSCDFSGLKKMALDTDWAIKFAVEIGLLSIDAKLAPAATIEEPAADLVYGLFLDPRAALAKYPKD